MRKLIYVCAALLSMGFAACSGSGKTSSGTDSESAQTEVQATKEDSGLGYKVTDKGMVPTTGRPMVVDFSAVWCPPCQQLKPIFAQLKEEYAGQVDFVTIDTDSMPELAKMYEVHNIPTLIFISKDGEVKQRTIGFIPGDSIKKEIKICF